MSRIARIAAGAVLAGIALSAVPASAEAPCTVTLEDRRFSGPGGGTWSMTYPVITCNS